MIVARAHASLAQLQTQLPKTRKNSFGTEFAPPRCMQTTTRDFPVVSVPEAAAAERPSDVVRGRTTMAAALTALTLAFAVGFGVAFGLQGLLAFALTLPVPLVLLWLSSDVARSDER